MSHVSYIKSQSGGNSGQLVFKTGNLPILNTEPTVCHSVSFLFAETASGATVYKTIDVKPKALENNTRSLVKLAFEGRERKQEHVKQEHQGDFHKTTEI